MDGLPADVCRKIFSFMKGKELARVSCVCKPWNKLLQGDEVWESVFRRLYKGMSVVEEEIEWKDVYVQKCRWKFGEVVENLLEGFNARLLHLHKHFLVVAGWDKMTQKGMYGLLDIWTGRFTCEESREFRFELSVHHDGWVVVPGNHAHSCRVLLWNLQSGEKSIRLLNGQGVVSCLDFGGAPPQTIVTGSASPKIKVWDLVRDECVMTLMTEGKGVHQVVYQAQDRRVIAGISVGGRTVIAVFNTASGECLTTVPIDQHLEYMSCAGKKMVTFSRGSIRGKVQVWHRETGECLRTLATDTIGTSCFAMNRRIICRATLRSITVWDMDSGQCFRSIDLRKSLLQTLPKSMIPSIGSFSGLDFDGNRVACSFQTGVTIVLSMRDDDNSEVGKRTSVVIDRKESCCRLQKAFWYIKRFSLITLISMVAFQQLSLW